MRILGLSAFLASLGFAAWLEGLSDPGPWRRLGRVTAEGRWRQDEALREEPLPPSAASEARPDDQVIETRYRHRLLGAGYTHVRVLRDGERWLGPYRDGALAYYVRLAALAAAPLILWTGAWILREIRRRPLRS